LFGVWRELISLNREVSVQGQSLNIRIFSDVSLRETRRWNGILHCLTSVVFETTGQP